MRNQEKQKLSLKARLSRGQAMLEYSLVSHALLIGGAAIAWPFLAYMMRALSIYFQSIYFIVTSPVP